VKNIDVFCVFPEAVDAMLRVGVVGRAIERGVVGYRSFDLRQFSRDGRIDDMPYGGGAGMVVRVDVVARAFEEVYGVPARDVRNGRRVVLTEPAGRPMAQGYIEEVTSGPDLTVVCGRYGGVDERVRTGLCTEAVSLGDFVLSGGEIVAAAIADAVTRRLDGVLGNAESLVGESFSEAGMVGPPMYTRPALWDGEEVPGVLLSGNHAEIRAWRERESLGRARARESGRRSP
jgi:tRNA (guanine37-N1)-methyltransferase